MFGVAPSISEYMVFTRVTQGGDTGRLGSDNSSVRVATTYSECVSTTYAREVMK